MVDISAAQDKSLCALKIKSINAPFNIMGVPAFEGYYVTHALDPVRDTMTFVPHKDSDKSELRTNLADPETAKKFSVKMESENTENAGLIAFLIALVLALAIIGVTVAITL